jgi:spore coat protein A
VQETYNYDNDQEPTTLWYHDHALGITRLNVYAGLAGFYLLRDDWEESLNLPSGDYEVPIVIQDRMFTTDGELFFPSEPEEEGAPEPSVLPEFFGDFILVNGTAWPYLEVQPRKYRFRLLNGSDSRFYRLWITSEDNPMGPPVWQIGTDEGFLYAPVALNQLALGPGERADLVVDFTDWAGHTLMLRNNAKTPFPDGETIDPNTVGQILQLRVSSNPVEDPSVLPAVLRPEPIAIPGTPTRVRQLLLFEGTDVYGRLQPLLGIVDPSSPDNGTLAWDDEITENPMLDDVEVWEIFNATEDAHPIHLHLVAFQILNRQRFSGTLSPKPMGEGTIGGILSEIRLRGKARPPARNENGWKDTAQMFPGEVTRIIARFDRAGKYVWHCHILSHEDHEMMRPYEVLTPLSKASGSDKPLIASPSMVEIAPLTGGAIRFKLRAPGPVAAAIFDVQGRFVRRLGETMHAAGPNLLLWDGRTDAGAVVASGIYFYRLSAPGFTQEGKVLLAR